MEYKKLLSLKDLDTPKKNDGEIIIPYRLIGGLSDSIFTVEFISDAVYIVRKYYEDGKPKWYGVLPQFTGGNAMPMIDFKKQ